MSSHSPQNFCQSFSSINTTKGTKALSFTSAAEKPPTSKHHKTSVIHCHVFNIISNTSAFIILKSSSSKTTTNKGITFLERTHTQVPLWVHYSDHDFLIQQGRGSSLFGRFKQNKKDKKSRFILLRN